MGQYMRLMKIGMMKLIILLTIPILIFINLDQIWYSDGSSIPGHSFF